MERNNAHKDNGNANLFIMSTIYTNNLFFLNVFTKRNEQNKENLALKSVSLAKSDGDCRNGDPHDPQGMNITKIFNFLINLQTNMKASLSVPM